MNGRKNRSQKKPLLKKIKRMFEEYRVPDKYCGRQHGKIMWINGKKIELPDNDPGGEHE